MRALALCCLVLLTGMAHLAAVETGATAPGFTLSDQTGKERSLSEFAGSWVVLEWLNYGCPFVKKHYGSHSMQTLQSDLTSKGVVWLSIISSAPGKQGAVDGAGAIADMETHQAHPSAVLLDPDGTVGRAYAAKTTPHCFVISPEGVIVYQGAIDSNPSADPADIPAATNYVAQAYAEASAGKPVTVPESVPYGCSVKY
jgi:hypothetical protein